MIFFDPDQYWEKDAEFDPHGQVKTPGIKINDAIRNVIGFARARKGDAAACLEKVRFTTDVNEILVILDHHSLVAVAQMNSLLGASALATDLASKGGVDISGNNEQNSSPAEPYASEGRSPRF